MAASKRASREVMPLKDPMPAIDAATTPDCVRALCWLVMCRGRRHEVRAYYEKLSSLEVAK